VDSGAMTDSIITDSLPPADPGHVPTMQPPPNSFDTRDSRCPTATATDEKPAVIAVEVNGYAEHDDGENSTAGSGESNTAATSAGVSSVADRTKLPPELRTSGCGGRNLGNSSSAAALLLTNGH